MPEGHTLCAIHPTRYANTDHPEIYRQTSRYTPVSFFRIIVGMVLQQGLDAGVNLFFRGQYNKNLWYEDILSTLQHR